MGISCDGMHIGNSFFYIQQMTGKDRDSLFQDKFLSWIKHRLLNEEFFKNIYYHMIEMVLRELASGRLSIDKNNVNHPVVRFI